VRERIRNLTEPDAAKKVREDRLPRWARDELTKLRSALRDLEEETAKDRPDSRVFLDPYRTRVPLGPDPHVRWVMDPNDSDDWIDVDFADVARGPTIRQQGCIRVRSGHSLAVYPEGANGVRIESLTGVEAAKRQR
jgi:hypothetical protein